MTEIRSQCSFCGKTQDEVRKLVGGPIAFICDECIDLCKDIIGTHAYNVAYRKLPAGQSPHKPRTLICSYCSDTEDEVRRLVAGPTVFICEECVRRFSN